MGAIQCADLGIKAIAAEELWNLPQNRTQLLVPSFVFDDSTARANSGRLSTRPLNCRMFSSDEVSDWIPSAVRRKEDQLVVENEAQFNVTTVDHAEYILYSGLSFSTNC